MQLARGRAGALAALVLVVAAPARADDASGTVRVYTDDDHLTVWSPAAHADVDVGRATATVDAAVDAVSAASVDVVTSASPATVHERRFELGLGASLPLATTTLRASATGSHEHDYDAIHGAVGVSRELAERNTTIAVTARAGRDRATDVTDAAFRRSRTSAGLVAVLTQVLDARTIADLTVDASWADGWHGNPYRRVWIADPMQPIVTGWREATPTRRVALAAALRLRRAIGRRWFVSGSARGYADDWAVHSATALATVRRRAGAYLLGTELRGYVQDAASFWRAHQPDGAAPPRYRTADRTLGAMADLSIAAIAARALGDRTVTAQVGAMRLWFVDDPAQAARTAVTVTVSFESPL